MSTADFKEKIGRLMGGADALAVGKTNPAIVRTRTDRGYYPSRKIIARSPAMPYPSTHENICRASGLEKCRSGAKQPGRLHPAGSGLFPRRAAQDVYRLGAGTPRSGGHRAQGRAAAAHSQTRNGWPAPGKSRQNQNAAAPITRRPAAAGSEQEKSNQ